MQIEYQGIGALMQYLSSELFPFHSELQSDVLLLIENYIYDKLSLEELLEAFNRFNISENFAEKIELIKKVVEEPLYSAIDSNSTQNNTENKIGPKKKREIWSSYDDIRLLGAITRFGLGNWKDISTFVGNNKSPAQCSQRWRRTLDPNISKELWSKDEELSLFKYVCQYGDKSWVKIASMMKNRSDTQCRNHFQQIKENFQKSVLLFDIDQSTQIFSEQLQTSIKHFHSTNFASVIDDQENHICYPLPQLETAESHLKYENNFLKKENFELKKQNMLLNMNKRSLQKKNLDFIKRSNLIIRNKDREISYLNNLLEKIEKSKNEQNRKVVAPTDLTEKFISSLIVNSHIKPSGRRYSSVIYDLSFVLYVHSNITYKILRTFLPLPSETMLYEKYGDQIKKNKDNLLNSNQIQMILNEFKNELNDENEIVATIAYDAATVDPVGSNGSNLFVFNVQPLDGTKKSRICHITQNSSGKTDDLIKSIVQKIVEASSESNFHFLYVATDGETGTNKIHSDFNKFIQNLNTFNFDEIIDNIESYPELIPISDWLHILKDLRSRFATNNISMFPGAPVFNAKQINDILHLDDLVITASGPSSMRDDLALHLFNVENMQLLAEKNEFCAFSFLFPFTLVTIAIGSENLNKESRYKLVKIAFNVIIELRQHAKGMRSKRSKRTPDISVRFAMETTCIRLINTLIALGCALKFYEKNLNLSRLFTHLVECIFGNMRRITHGDDRSTSAINALVKQQMAKQILDKYDLDPVHIRGRIDAASAADIGLLSSKWQTDLCEILDDRIPDELILLMNDEINYEETQTYQLMSFICSNVQSYIPSLNTKKRKGDSILSRQVAYNGKK